MFQELTKEIKAQLYERAKSPLFGTFALAWLAWNFLAVAAVFSDMKFPEKVAYWNALYPGWWDRLASLAVYPLLSSIGFILVYPHPARWTFRYWFGQHRRLKEVQQKIEDETPMTQEEANDLRRGMLEQQLVWQKQLSDASKANAELRQQVDQLMKELSNARQAIPVLPIEQPKLSISAGQRDEESSDDRSESLSVTASSLIKLLSEERKRKLYEAFAAEDERLLAAFLAFVARSGYLDKSDLGVFPDITPIDMRFAFPILERAGLIEEFGSYYALTDQGNAMASTSGLTKLVPLLRG